MSKYRTQHNLKKTDSNFVLDNYNSANEKQGLALLGQSIIVTSVIQGLREEFKK